MAQFQIGQPTSIEWAVDELNTELNQALRILESYAESDGEKGSLDESIQHMKQVTGIFAVTGLALPQLLGEELQTAIREYSNQTGQAATDTISLVAEAILELNSYLGNTKRAKRLVPQINNLRALTERELFTESNAVEIPLEKGYRAFNKSRSQPLDSQTIRKLRMLYQKTVLSLFKEGLAEETLANLQKVFKVLYQMGGTAYLSATGYAALTLLERLQTNNLKLNTAVKAQFKRLDELLKNLNAGKDYEDIGLLKNILYYVASGSDHDELSAKLIELFQLEDFNDVTLAGDQGHSIAMEPELVAKVVEVLQTEIEQAKTWLDDCLHQVCEFNEALQQVTAILRRADDTLVMVGADQPRETAQNLQAILSEWAKLASEKEISPEELDRFANVMVKLEHQLLSLSNPSANDPDQPTGIASARITVITESRIALTQIKTSITQFIDSNWEWTMLREVPASLAMVEGALRFYPLEDLAKVVNCVRRYVRESLLERQQEPDQEEINLFADIIVAVDYYLECLERGTAFNLEFLIERALENCTKLGFSFDESFLLGAPGESEEEPAEAVIDPDQQDARFADTSQFQAKDISPEQSVTAPSEEPKEEPTETEIAERSASDEPLSDPIDTPSSMPDDDDFEIIEIFVEEASEILPMALEQLKDWRNNQDKASLFDLRRGFHTLKGGGRMIGASILGELSWAIENMLNRVIDNSVELTPEIYELTQSALDQYPGLLVQLTDTAGETTNDEIERIQNRANVISDPLSDSADISVAEEAIESEPETTQEDSNIDLEASPTADDEPVALEEKQSEPEITELTLTFANEAEAHRQTIVQLTGLASTNSKEDISEQLVATLHTLSDSARVAEFDDLADSFVPLQKVLQHYNSVNTSLSSEFIAVLSIWAGKFDSLLNTLKDKGLLDVSVLATVVKSANDLLEREEKALANDPASDRKKRFLPLHNLMAEQLDRLIIAEQLLYEWQMGQLDPQDLDGLHDDINLLKDTAETCKVQEIVTLCELIDQVQSDFTGERSLAAAPASWLDESYALLLKMLDAVASWQVLPKVDQSLMTSAAALKPDEQETEKISAESEAVAVDTQQEEASATIAIEPEEPIKPELDLDSNFMDPEDEFQQELMDTFLEEADDLMQEIDNSISAWRRDPNALDNADLIHRALHTLKGGARLSGLSKLGDYSHEFESFIIDQQVLQKADEAFFTHALERLDHLHTHIEVVRETMLTGGSIAEIAAPDTPAEPEIPESDHAPEEAVGNNEEVAIEEPLSAIPAEDLAPTDPPLADKLELDNQIDQAVNEKLPESEEAEQQTIETRQRQDNIRLRADLVEEMVNLSSEATVYRGRVEAQLVGLDTNLDELESTIGRIQQLARRLDTETEAQIQFRSEQLAEAGDEEDFDPLEMDRYSTLQQLSHQLIESASDLQDLRASLSDANRDTNVLLTQSGRIQSELNAQLMRTRMVPFEQLLPRLERIVRQVSRELGKKAEIRALDISGELDRTVLEQLVPPIEHILRNSIDHGIEDTQGRKNAHKPQAGRITVNLHREGSYMVLTLTDDGRGIDFEAVRRRAISRGLVNEAESTTLARDEIAEFLFMPGFSTAETVTQISGRGVGMDVVRATIREMGGSVSVRSELGRGTQFLLSIPFTTSVNRALMVHVGDDLYALPLASLEALVRISRADLESYYQNAEKKLPYGADEYDFGYLGELLKTRERPPLDAIIEPTVSVVLFRVGNHRVALLIDEIIGSNEVVVKSLSQPFNAVPGLSGAAIMGDGSVVVTLDMPALIASHFAFNAEADPTVTIQEKAEETRTPVIMVVDDSVTVRKVTSRFLTREGFVVQTARDGAEALRMVHDHTPDLMLVDVEMPRMDGFELLAALRSSDKFEGLPIVLITSRTGAKHKQRGLSLGANNYFGKPYREDELLLEIKRLLAGD